MLYVNYISKNCKEKGQEKVEGICSTYNKQKTYKE